MRAAICFIAILFAPFRSIKALGQTRSVAPGPAVGQCSALLPRGASEVGGHDSLIKAIAAMDTHGSYRSKRRFKISGALDESDRAGGASVEIGTFQNIEDHTSPNGDFKRQSIIHGKERATSRTTGTLSFSDQQTSKVDLTKLPFQPKSYLFPLALLTEEADESHTKVYIVPSGVANPSVVRLVITNLSSGKTSQYETEDWYLDASTYLPQMVAHYLPTSSDPNKCVRVYTSFSNYQNLSDTTIPTTISTNNGRPKRTSVLVQSVSY
jgi:hypothetical protein